MLPTNDRSGKRQYPLFSIFLFVMLLNFLPVSAQKQTLPFRSGERVEYEVSYNWKFVWINAGKVVFEVDSLQYGDKPAYHFKSTGRSLSTYDLFFKVRDKFESVADAGNFSPYWYKRKTREGSYRADNKYNFIYEDSIIISQTKNSHQPYRKDTLSLNSFVLDLQTAVYYARTLDFNNMKSGQKIPFRIIIDGKIYDLSGRYIGIENIENQDGRIYRCHKFAATLVGGTIFSSGEEVLVWVTDDQNHIPILVEASILVGSVKAYFTKGENIFHPMESIIR